MKEQEEIYIPNIKSVKFFMLTQTKDGEKIGVQILNLDKENEEYKKQIISDLDSCDYWIFYNTIGQMNDIKEGMEKAEKLKDFKIFQINVPKKTANTKLPDKEKLIDKILRKVQKGVNRKDYPFKTIVHVIGAKDYSIFSNNKKPISTKDPY